jgi:putative nucleotidyltransferase with HDIG domain
MFYDEITKLVGIIVSLREPYDHHGSGVASLAVKMAQAMGMKDSEVEMIETGAHLHDIGKILVRREILNAAHRLSPEERAEMETHATLGWSIVERAGYAPTILQIVRSHHEHWNGSGYPDRLAGEEIPLVARMIGICDAYDALTNKRAYREAYSHNFAMAMIQKDKGQVFDAQLVDLFFAKVAK